MKLYAGIIIRPNLCPRSLKAQLFRMTESSQISLISKTPAPERRKYLYAAVNNVFCLFAQTDQSNSLAS